MKWDRRYIKWLKDFGGLRTFKHVIYVLELVQSTTKDIANRGENNNADQRERCSVREESTGDKKKIGRRYKRCFDGGTSKDSVRYL